MKRAAYVCLGLLAVSTSAHAERKPQMRVAVAEFDAPKESRARNEVLATLSEHDDIEVVSLEDIAFAAKRAKADPTQPAGRTKLAAELGIDAWIDGQVDGSEAEISMTSVADDHVRKVSVQAASPKLLDATVGERMWAAMGPSLSGRERGRRAQLAQMELARAKLAAREQEQQRQIAVAQERAEQRVTRLRSEHDLALKKRAAVGTELARQGQLVKDRIMNDAVEQQKLIDERRQAEALPVAQAQLSGVSAAPANQATNQSSNAPAAGPGQVSTATQRWLQAQQNAGPSGGVVVPAQPTPFAANSSGVSPATQRWLAQQQTH